MHDDDEYGLNIEFPRRTTLEKLASEDPEALKRLQLTNVAISSGGDGSCQFDLSDD